MPRASDSWYSHKGGIAMRRMLLVVLAAASITLSAGAVLAEQVVVCSPGCGPVNSTEAQNMKQNQGKTTAGSHISSQGASHNKAGVSQGTNGGGGDSGGTIMIMF